ncbi:MAG: M23 family metallopeptidase [Anaerolineales bacterium]
METTPIKKLVLPTVTSTVVENTPTYPAKNSQTPETAIPSPRFPQSSCQPQICIYDVSFPLQRPIAPIGNLKVEASYRYGSTQNGQREVHHGVDIINKAGVPVLAAADGIVVFAGSDDQQSFATKRNFYGKLVILKHKIPGLEEPIYTLYGHLLKILVASGSSVQVGEQIGEVGLGGVAAGTHLHFEVRYGKNEYDATRNPELWFPPLLPSNGVLAGNFFDIQHKTLSVTNFLVEPLNDAETTVPKYYFSTYEDAAMLNLPPWNESFGINDLPAGKYHLTLIYHRPIQIEFEIQPSKLTYLNIQVR